MRFLVQYNRSFNKIVCSEKNYRILKNLSEKVVRSVKITIVFSNSFRNYSLTNWLRNNMQTIVNNFKSLFLVISLIFKNDSFFHVCERSKSLIFLHEKNSFILKYFVRFQKKNMPHLYNQSAHRHKHARSQITLTSI